MWIYAKRAALVFLAIWMTIIGVSSGVRLMNGGMPSVFLGSGIILTTICLALYGLVTQASGEADAMIAQARGEQQAAVTRAKGEAEANALLGRSITPDLLEWRRLSIAEDTVSAWDGKRPMVEGEHAGLLFTLPKTE